MILLRNGFLFKQASTKIMLTHWTMVVFPEDQQKIIKESCKPNPKYKPLLVMVLSSPTIDNIEFLTNLKTKVNLGLDFNEVLFINRVATWFKSPNSYL